MLSVEPALHRFTVDEYHRMVDAGIFGDDDRVELLDGVVFEMPPVAPPHAATVNALSRLLVLGFGERAVVGVQNPVGLSDLSEPQPDLTVLRDQDDFYWSGHPQPADVLVMIEVADSTLPWDRRFKAPLYARAGIATYWLVDVAGEAVEVFTEPAADGYRKVDRVARGGELEVAGVTIRVDDVFRGGR